MIVAVDKNGNTVVYDGTNVVARYDEYLPVQEPIFLTRGQKEMLTEEALELGKEALIHEYEKCLSEYKAGSPMYKRTLAFISFLSV